ncbi:MAG: DUF192 domain-containing protein [Planctomycetes bacterium]|nr:DUF192 domain-containing protein [Planctomycetota bacterium]MCW8135770.1 DUF192 domain-containing protein [Planctomycetota bacterium]
MRTSLCLLSLAAVCLLLSACGPDKEKVEPLAWPYMESLETLTINGTEFKAFIASSEMHRRRAINGLAVKSGQAVALLYPDLPNPVELEFKIVPDPMDLVFVAADGKAVLVESVPAFAESTFPRIYGGKKARIVLQLPAGTAKELGIAAGKDVKTSPDLLDKSKGAEAEFARMYFVRNERPEEKPEPAPFVSLKVLTKPADVAQLMKDRDDLAEGQGVIVPFSSKHAQFWLKGVKGKVCAAWVENVNRNKILTAIYEGIEAGGGSDLDEPIYNSPGKASYLAIWKGADFFSKNKIEKRSSVTIAGVDAFEHDAIDYGNIELKVGDDRLEARLAVTEDARTAALKEAPALEKGKAVVLAWDDPSHVEVEAPAGASLWFIGADHTIAHREKTAGGKVGFKAQSRFVIAVPSGFEPKGEFKLPYLLQDLKPSLPAIVFYNAKQKDVVTDRWPGKAENFKGRARVELAMTPAEQRRGLMFRESLRDNHGMLFIYPTEEDNVSYWMKNCKMNLSIAFANDRGVIVKIYNVMTKPAPGTPDHELDLYPAGAPVRFAVEMRENWFKDNGINEGDRIFIPPSLTESK